MRNATFIVPLLLLTTGALFACETETTSCQDAVDCAALGGPTEVCCTEDGTNITCQYTAPDGETFVCDTYAVDDEMGESCDEAATDLAAYCLEE